MALKYLAIHRFVESHSLSLIVTVIFCMMGIRRGQTYLNFEGFATKIKLFYVEQLCFYGIFS